MLVVCVLRVSVEASIRMSMFRLILLVRVVSLSSIMSASSFMAFVKIFSDSGGAEALVLSIACVFWAITSRTGAWASRIAVWCRPCYPYVEQNRHAYLECMSTCGANPYKRPHSNIECGTIQIDDRHLG